jgi:hypothetical protein
MQAEEPINLDNNNNDKETEIEFPVLKWSIKVYIELPGSNSLWLR